MGNRGDPLAGRGMDDGFARFQKKQAELVLLEADNPDRIRPVVSVVLPKLKRNIASPKIGTLSPSVNANKTNDDEPTINA